MKKVIFRFEQFIALSTADDTMHRVLHERFLIVFLNYGIISHLNSENNIQIKINAESTTLRNVCYAFLGIIST